jgi:hypothetical protein
VALDASPIEAGAEEAEEAAEAAAGVAVTRPPPSAVAFVDLALALADTPDAPSKAEAPTTIGRGARFYFSPPFAVSGVNPALVPSAGGVDVTIRGGPFPMDARVRVEAALSEGELGVSDEPASSFLPVVWRDAATLSFRMPPRRPTGRGAPLRVCVSPNGGADVRCGGELRVVPTATVSGAAPLSGPIRGGTRVRVAGAGFLAGGAAAAAASSPSAPLALFCSFGGAAVRARVFNDSAAECEAPPSRGLGDVPVAFSLRRADAPLSLTGGAASPSEGALSLRGASDFTPLGEGAASEVIPLVLALELELAPPSPLPGSPLRFRYLPAPRIAAVEPPAGAVDGATRVLLLGSGFGAVPPAAPGALRVRFGAAEGVGAEWAAPGAIRVATPPAALAAALPDGAAPPAPLAVAIAVSLNGGADWSEEGAM